MAVAPVHCGFRAKTLLAVPDDDPPRSRRDAVRQVDLPLALVPVHAEDDRGVRAWVVEGCLQEQEIRPKLAYRERSSIDQQAYPDIGRMAGMTGRDQDG